ncbi:decaprenyl-phosphate phosphoribosyltransferase [Paenibacillus thiaminolyticus]|uniref:decaprenyl-phosphate phosphoribosyltransferase n=1 Tax=Paenibacillus thiaminolyticus TaxID=49283 RepID=UPI003D265037
MNWTTERNKELILENNKSFIFLFVKEMRPKQWSKNLLVFAALIFSINDSNTDAFIFAALGFLCFCFISSCVYVINDYLDREADRLHPIKKYRPIASGLLNPKLALLAGSILFVGTCFLSFYINFIFGIILLIYFFLNITYSMKLKHIVILDVMTIALGFGLRAIGGAIIINVNLTPWFLICTMLLALFLAVSKRRHELYLLNSDGGNHRKVLDKYSFQLIDQINTIAVTSTIVSYALFTFTSGHTIHLMWTLPFVIYGIFRYLYIIHIEKDGGAPDKILFEDRHLLITVILYGLTVIAVLTLFE